jgi:DNA-directed RNA polymerase specialized sigma24 family protein
MYETIRAGLLRIFVSKGFSDAEKLVDDVVDRVAGRLSDIGPHYEGEKVAYFRGVARKIVLEAGRSKEVATGTLPERPVQVTEVSDEYECLLKCLKFFSPEKRDLILDYHVYEGADKILNHQTMAEELRISETALRVQAHRARTRLEKCVLECVEALERKQKPS